MPFDGGLAIDSQGGLWGWGVNTANELCLPGPSVVLRPTQLPVHGVTLATGAARHIVFDAGGTVYACGQGLSGQLGTGSFGKSATPVAVVGLPAVGVKALTSSWMGSGALMNDGSYYDWGYNASGQLGNGTTTNSAVPVHVPLPAPVAQASMGGSTAANGQTIVLLDERRCLDLGQRSFGQMGNGTTLSSLVTHTSRGARGRPLGVRRTPAGTPPTPSTPPARCGPGAATTWASSAPVAGRRPRPHRSTSG